MSDLQTKQEELMRLNDVISSLECWGPNAESLQRDYDYLLKEVRELQKTYGPDSGYHIDTLRWRLVETLGQVSNEQLEEIAGMQPYELEHKLSQFNS